MEDQTSGIKRQKFTSGYIVDAWRAAFGRSWRTQFDETFDCSPSEMMARVKGKRGIAEHERAMALLVGALDARAEDLRLMAEDFRAWIDNVEPIEPMRKAQALLESRSRLKRMMAPLGRPVLARRLGVTPVTVSRWIHAHAGISRDNREEIKKLYQVTFSD